MGYRTVEGVEAARPSARMIEKHARTLAVLGKGKAAEVAAFATLVESGTR